MTSKHPLKSKTIMFAIVTIIAALFNIVSPDADGIDADMTWRQLSERQTQSTDNIMDLLILIGGSGAIYGRVVAKDKIGGKDA